MIVIKKARRAKAAHHGGAWKVAYADFVTAMMAFFLLLWLLNAVSQEQLEGISDYFAPISMDTATSGGGGLLQGRALDTRGVFNAREHRVNIFADVSPTDGNRVSHPDEAEPGEPQDPDAAALDEERQEKEDADFKAAEDQIRMAIESRPDLAGLADSVLIDRTTEGLRIQIVDQERLPMFPLGSAEMHAHTRKLLELVARVLAAAPQDIAISGHTDANPYLTDRGYGNWELSADRANAARRAVIELGVPESRITRVVGRAATSPLITDDPKAPGNRRLSIVLLHGTGTVTPHASGATAPAVETPTGVAAMPAGSRG
jgi:chemotaxis protein MotB